MVYLSRIYTKTGDAGQTGLGDGTRVVKEGFDTAQLFMVGGIHHDAGLEFPVVPLGGIDYFNFNLFNKGIQANVFFAGLVVAANATHPNVANTRTNVGVETQDAERHVRKAVLLEPAESADARPSEEDCCGGVRPAQPQRTRPSPARDR